MSGLTIMIGAWIGVAIWIFFVIATNKKVHPRALFYLFFVELWERFSYYGMRALLVLYMTAELVKGGFGFEDKRAYGIYAAYGAMVYATPLIGGFLAEKFLGYRKSIMWGAILMALGHFAMAFEARWIFFTALALLILGNGFFKPNISSLIGKLYGEGDPRRDGGFTIFYMGINIGAFLTPLTCGYLGETYGWHYGFTIAGIGMVVGLIIFWIAQRDGVLEDKGYAPHQYEEPEDTAQAGQKSGADNRVLNLNAPSPKYFGLPVSTLIYIGSFLALPLVYLLIESHGVLDYLLGAMGLGMIIYLIVSSFNYEIKARQRIWAVVVMFFFPVIFWTFFELAGSALTLFTDRNVIKTSFFTTTMFQSLNPFFIMLFAPIFSWMWIKLSKSGYEPPAPIKFAAGLILLGIGFLVLNLSKGSAVDGMIPAMFMVGLYLFHTLGELALSPVGLSLVTKLSPAKIVGLVMGFWMLSSSFAHKFGEQIANLTAVDGNATPQQSLELCLGVFTNLGYFAIGAGIFLLLISPIITKWMHGIK